MPLPEYFAPSGDSLAQAVAAGPQFRSGAYVCQCPARLARLQDELPVGDGSDAGANNDKRRLDATSAAELQRDSRNNNNNNLDLMVDFGPVPSKFALDDKRAVAQVLLRRQLASSKRRLFLAGAKQRPDGRATTKSNSSSSSSSLPLIPSFELGATLEAKLALRQLVSPRSGRLEPNDLATTMRILMASGLASGDFSVSSSPLLQKPARSCAACDLADASCLRETLREVALANNKRRSKHRPLLSLMRPLILGLQISCFLLALVLIGVMLRIQHSRVSKDNSSD